MNRATARKLAIPAALTAAAAVMIVLVVATGAVRPRGAVLPTASPAPTPTALASNPAPSPAPTVRPTEVQAPSPYAVPAGALTVTTSSALATALSATRAQDIVLADGTYDSSAPFNNISGHRLYAATLGGAVLSAGINIGETSRGAIVRGLSFDVADRSKVVRGSVVHVLGPGTRILDLTVRGNKAIDSGIFAREPDGLVVQRVVVRDFHNYGVFADANDRERVLATPALLEDIDVAGVVRPVPRSSNGRAEACVWLGNTGTVRYAKLRSCAWQGLWTGTNNDDALYEDIDIDLSPVAVWIEHFTTGATFQRLRIGPGVEIGITCEWADPAWDRKPACVDNVIQDSTILSSKVGVYLDEGTMRTTIRRVKFENQSVAAIVDYRGVGNAYAENDYSAIAQSARPTTEARPNLSGGAAPR